MSPTSTLLPEAPAPVLAERLFAGDDAWRAFPFWADGGDGAEASGTGYLSPGHLLTALPSRVDRLRVEDLPFRGLGPWLRRRLTRSGAPAPLHVVGLSYDLGRNLERLPERAHRDTALPDLVVATYPAFLASSGPSGPWHLHATDDEARRALVAHLERPASPGPPAALPTALSSGLDEADHRRAVTEVLAAIARGDLYQANVARRLEAPMDPALTPALHRALRKRSPAHLGALWAFGEGEWLSSVSPECLLTFDPATRVAHSYPIKGTRPRGADLQGDRRLAAELRADPKERAEHVMIVDLVRNDLGRVAEPGGVRVPELLGVQHLPTVHHLVSDVAATVRQGADLADLLVALFPGGSITGAPKIAAMACLEHLEPVRRGLYTGSLGVVDGLGRATFNILIRSCVVEGGRVTYHTGGGIVADSDPAAEWLETEAKAAALRRALGQPTGP